VFFVTFDGLAIVLLIDRVVTRRDLEALREGGQEGESKSSEIAAVELMPARRFDLRVPNGLLMTPEPATELAAPFTLDSTRV